MRKGDESKISFSYPFESFPSDLQWARWRNLLFIYFEYYSVWNQFFLLKYTLRFFIFKFDLNVKYRPYCLQKKLFIEKTIFFSVDYAKINELHEIQNISRSIPLSK